MLQQTKKMRFDDFLKFSNHFPKSSEDSPNLFEGHKNIAKHFPQFFKNFGRFPKITQVFWGRPEEPFPKDSKAVLTCVLYP